MIVSVFESGNSDDLSLLQSSDLALKKTDEETWDGKRLYRVIKNRFSSDEALVPEDEIREFARKQEAKTSEVKGKKVDRAV